MANLEKLSNGIPVLYEDCPGEVATVYWWVRAGSADEKKGEEGFAHYLEHLLFKDSDAKKTGQASTGQTARLIEGWGGEINAYTTFDQTVYHVACAATHWEKVLDVFGQMARPPSFLKTDFEREREVIIEEIRKNEDSPDRVMFQGLFSGLYKKHPYGRPVIGYVSTIQKAKAKAVEAFYKRNYVSERMGLVLVGPIGDKDSARKKAIFQKLEKHYGEKVIKKTQAQWLERPVEPDLRPRLEARVRSFDVQSPSVCLGFRVPDLMHADVPALDLGMSVLGSGELSRLYQRLFYKDKLVTGAGGSLYIPKDKGMAFLQAEVDSIDKMKPALQAMAEEIRRMVSDGPTREELDRVLVQSESEKIYSRQSAEGIASRLGYLSFVLGDPHHDQAYLEELRQTTPQKIQKMLGHYLVQERMTVSAMVPKALKSKDVEKDLREILERAFAKTSVSISNSKAKPTTERPALPVESMTAEKMRTYAFERPQTQVFSIYMTGLGGLRLENPKDWGISSMLSDVWIKGTSKKTSQDISRLVEGSASRLEGISGRNTVGLAMSGLAKDFDKLTDLFIEVATEPSFAGEELENSVRVTEDQIKSIDDHSSQLCVKLFQETLFDQHPYRKMTIGSLETIHRMTPARLTDYHREWLRPERLVVSVAGSIDPAKAQEFSKKLSAKLASIARSKSQIDSPVLAEETPLLADRFVERKLGREQVHILVGRRGIRMDDEERFAMRLLQTMLSGQGGRLFVELREKKSLAYSVSPMSMEGVERGYVGTYIACAPTKAQEALKGIETVYEAIQKKGIAHSELIRAQEFFLGSRAMDLQSDGSWAAHFAMAGVYGLPIQTQAEIAKRIRSVSSRQIQSLIEKYFMKSPKVTAIVG